MAALHIKKNSVKLTLQLCVILLLFVPKTPLYSQSLKKGKITCEKVVIPSKMQRKITSSSAEAYYIAPMFDDYNNILYYARIEKNIKGNKEEIYQFSHYLEYELHDSTEIKEYGTTFESELAFSNNTALAGISEKADTLYIYFRSPKTKDKKMNGIFFIEKTLRGWGDIQKINIPGAEFDLSLPKNKKKSFGIFVHPSGNVMLISTSLKKSDSDDLFFSTKDENGKWSYPRSLGKTINHPTAHEFAPFLSKDQQTLYFTRGTPERKMTIMYAERLDASWTKWTKPKVLPSPINDKKSNQAYFYLMSDSKGHFASDRDGTMELYDFYIEPYPEEPKVPLASKEKKEEQDLEEMSEVFTSADQSLKPSSSAGQSSKSKSSSEKSSFVDEAFITSLKVFFPYSSDMPLNGWQACTKTIGEYLKKNPDKILEITGNSDNMEAIQGRYNYFLAEQRAKRVYSLLVFSQKVDPRQLKLVPPFKKINFSQNGLPIAYKDQRVDFNVTSRGKKLKTNSKFFVITDETSGRSYIAVEKSKNSKKKNTPPIGSIRTNLNYSQNTRGQGRANTFSNKNTHSSQKTAASPSINGQTRKNLR